MKLAIGENIKFLRKTRDITQEGLAEILGVSNQSVSRWEQGVCYPDMELLPSIAELFGISVDKLLGVDDISEKKKVSEYLDRFQAAINVGEIDECIAIAREGVAEYPNNYILLNKLMYALFVSGDDDGNIPNWKENMEKYDREIIALGERIIKYCPDQNIRLEATARLAFQHCEMGRKTIGRSVYETLPPQKLCRENQIWWGLEEEEKLDFLRKKIMQDYYSLKDFVWQLADAKLLPDEESLEIMKKVFALDELVWDGTLPYESWGSAKIPMDLAKIYMRLGEYQNACQQLRIAVQAAGAFDNRPEQQCFNSRLLGDIEIKRSDYETSDTRKLRKIMREKWLADNAFDNIRTTKEFEEILLSLACD